MRYALMAALCLGGCATAMVEAPAPDPFANTDATLAQLQGTAKACSLSYPDKFQKYQISDMAQTYDQAACTIFDNVVQDALQPILYCADELKNDATTDLSTLCERYIGKFLSSGGAHALQLAYKEQAASRAYHAAIEGGMREEDARQTYLSDLVRYRD